jgi:hypothetical protein
MIASRTWLIPPTMVFLSLSPICFSQPSDDGATAEFELPQQIRSAADIPFRTTEFTFVRVAYDHRESARRGGAWATDYPDADQVFSAHFEQVTGIPTNPGGALRDYLLGGGFLMVDDFWGAREWESFAAQLRLAFPDREPVELTTDHEIFRSYYAFDEQPQVPPRGGTPLFGSEPGFFGLTDDTGRLMAIFCHNSDFGDGWEHAEDPWYPSEFSLGRALPMGINIVVYALSH